LIALIHGILAGVGSVYLTTKSVTITLIACAAAIALALLALIFRP
jgi:hypothetical protein